MTKMPPSVLLLVLWLSRTLIKIVLAELPQIQYGNKTIEAESIRTVIQSTSENHIVLLIQDQIYSRGDILDHLRAPRGVGIFNMERQANDTHQQIILLIEKAHLIAAKTTEVLVLVASDDSNFLSTFAEWSLRSRFLVWTTRLLLFTRLQTRTVRHLHETLSMTNSLLLTPAINNERVVVSAVLPYSQPSAQSPVVAFWTPGSGMSRTQEHQTFPEKFTKLSTMPNLLVAMTEDAMHRKFIVEDSASHSGQKFVFEGYMVDVMDYVAQGINFSYNFIPSPDNSYGNRRSDGTWTGMVGQVYRGEVDIGLGPFTVTTERATAVDFTYPVEVTSGRILAGQKKLEVDPWGFMLPLSPEVWMATFISLAILPGIISLLIYFFINKKQITNQWKKQQFGFLMMFLQESITIGHKTWWWERMVVGIWLLTTLVLRRSYEGNLMSLLAVRHIPQPYQSLRAVLDDPSSTMIWKKGSSFMELIQTSKSGIFREVMDTEKEGRLRFLRVKEYLSVLDEDVIHGKQVIIDFAFNLVPISGNYFSDTGKCNFYIGRERLIAQSLGMIGKKGDPIVHPMSKRIMTMIEAGLYYHWYIQGIPNATSCDAFSSKVTVITLFSLYNTWAMFAMLAGGLLLSLSVLILEYLISCIVM